MMIQLHIQIDKPSQTKNQEKSKEKEIIQKKVSEYELKVISIRLYNQIYLQTVNKNLRKASQT